MPRPKKGKPAQGQQDLFSWRMTPLTEQERDSLAQTYCRCPEGIDPRENYTDQRNQTSPPKMSYHKPLTTQLHELLQGTNTRAVGLFAKSIIAAGGQIHNVQEDTLRKSDILDWNEACDNTLFYLAYIDINDTPADDKWDWKNDRVFVPVV